MGVTGTLKVLQSRPDVCPVSWHVSQLAHSIRLLLEYTDSNYEEKKYTMGDGNGILVMSWLLPNSCWFGAKHPTS